VSETRTVEEWMKELKETYWVASQLVAAIHAVRTNQAKHSSIHYWQQELVNTIESHR